MSSQIKGWLSNRVFMQAKHMRFYKTGHWVVFIKTRTETCIKGWIELAVFKAFGEILSFGLGVAELVLVHLLTELFADGLSFVHSVVYDANKHTHNQDTGKISFIVELGKERIKYRGRSNNFEWFLSGMVKAESS